MADKNVVRDHSFDGIEEYDNNLPNWWSGAFVIGVLWAGAYLAYFHVFQVEKIGVERYIQETEDRAAALAAIASAPATPEELITMTHDVARIASGKEIFSKTCAVCHGPEAYGLVGPNLRDDFWIYGSDVSTLIETVTHGRKGGMPAQGSVLSPKDIESVVSYVVELNRSTEKEDGQTATGKAPAGDSSPIQY